MSLITGAGLAGIRRARRYALDVIPEPLYAALCLRRVRAWHGSELFLARRSSDGDIEGWRAGVDGWPDRDAFLSWRGGGIAYIDTIYDQEVNGHHAAQATTTMQALIDVDAAGRFFLIFDGSNDNLLIAGALNFPQSAGQLTMAAAANVTNGAALPFIIAAAQSSGANLRAGIGVSGSAARVSGRRLTTDAFTTIAGASGSGTGWRSYVGRIDYAGASADISSNGTTAAGAFLPPGAPAQDLATVLAPCIGGLYTAQMMAGSLSGVILARAAVPVATLTAILDQLRP